MISWPWASKGRKHNSYAKRKLLFENIDEHHFRTKRFMFRHSMHDFSFGTTDESVAFLKSPSMLGLYELYLPDQVQHVFELGFFHGGLPLLLADTVKPRKVVAIDYKEPSEALKRHIERAGLSNVVRLYGRTLQDDVLTLRRILDEEFIDQGLDLITDDCSHEYAQTRASFEATFGYLRPGGKFIIEDWGWAHWPGDEWQTEKSYFNGRPALTNLLFEILMLHASDPSIVSKVEVPAPMFAVVTRGTGLAHKETLKLDTAYQTAGRQFSLL
ncbi:class I SAM-dependent methyltransferase [Mesorhizobium sp. CC13]|uniref:class I SAM-dependent methyltransferase n=1 Tax=Mesorhizobium sp. CC13 TaxID=3029194 RepID=UPI003264DE66